MQILTQIFTIKFWKNIDYAGALKFGETHPLQIVVGIIAAIIGWKIFWWLVRYLHVRFTEKNLVFMQITLPRDDSPKDKEKDVEKDFRERIAIMEQLFRSLYEIRELSISNIIRRFFFQHHYVSFEIVAREKTVTFYVVVTKEYQSVVEKQITSYYTEADIQIVPSYEIQKKGNTTVGFYAYEKNPFWFPIKTFKTLENDPLNSMTNVLSKLEENETAVIQLVIRPRSGGWRKRAEEFGTEVMKGKERKSFLSKIPVLSQLNTLFTIMFFGYDRAKETMHAPGSDHGDPYIGMLSTIEEQAKQIGMKAEQDGFDTVIRLLVSASTSARADDVMNDCVVAQDLFKEAPLD